MEKHKQAGDIKNFKQQVCLLELLDFIRTTGSEKPTDRPPARLNHVHPVIIYVIFFPKIDTLDICRPHAASICYQTGYVRNGVVTMVTSGSCDGGPPRSQTWVTVNVKVHSNRNVQVFLNGKHVKTLDPQFQVTPKAGVIVGNGYDNIIQAKSFTIRKL